MTLVDQLRSDGFDVWIDQSGIDTAASWSKEIARALESCKAVLMLLSNSSLKSRNVAKELSVASELEKTIIPIELQSVRLTGDFLYHLSSIQRSSISDMENIISALIKIGIPSKYDTKKSQTYLAPAPPDPLGRKTIAVLPFENLRPDPENGWIADALTQELINVLSQIVQLRVKDRMSVKNYSTAGKSARRMADELSVRYLLEGTVTILGGTMRIGIELIDTVEDDHIWSKVFKGKQEEIFEIQERIGLEIAEALKLNLTFEERTNVARHLTDNMEAYEKYVLADEGVISRERSSLLRAQTLLREAVQLDPTFAEARAVLASIHTELFSIYTRDPKLLDDAEAECRAALEHQPQCALAIVISALVQSLRGNHRKAVILAHQALRLEPNDSVIQMWRGYVYETMNDTDRCIECMEIAERLQPDSIRMIWALGYYYLKNNDLDLLHELGNRVLPHYDRYISIHPEDNVANFERGIFLAAVGHYDEALSIADRLYESAKSEPIVMIGLASIYLICGNTQKSLNALYEIHGLGLGLHMLTSPFFKQLKYNDQYHALFLRFRKDANM